MHKSQFHDKERTGVVETNLNVLASYLENIFRIASTFIHVCTCASSERTHTHIVEKIYASMFGRFYPNRVS